MSDAQGRDPLTQAAAEGGLPTMSTDNTPEGQAVAAETGPIASVRDGMKVVDSLGEEVGSVRRVRMGDPSAVTTRGQRMERDDTWWDDFAEALFGPDSELPDSTRNDLERVGFIQIDARGIFNADYAASSEQIASVTGDTVTLTVDRNALIKV